MGEIKHHRHTTEVGRAFRSYVEQARADCTLFWVPNRSFLESKAWVELERLLDRWVEQLEPPVGLFAEESAVGRMVIQRCIEKGLDVPRDVAVLSQHNVKAVVDVQPQISSIEIDNERAGYEAARLLDRLMSGKKPPASPILVPPKGVVGRESTDYFAVKDPLVAQALRHIAAHLSEPLRVEEIAYQLAVSSRTLQGRFQEALGVGVSQEIRRLRLQKAKRLLIEPGMTISEVSDLSGFTRPQLFNAVFRRELGMTPSAYRQQHQAEDRDV